MGYDCDVRDQHDEKAHRSCSKSEGELIGYNNPKRNLVVVELTKMAIPNSAKNKAITTRVKSPDALVGNGRSDSSEAPSEPREV